MDRWDLNSTSKLLTKLSAGPVASCSHVMQGLIGSGRILIYTLLMMGTTLFIFAVFSVVLITKNDITKDHPLVLLYFPAVPEARGELGAGRTHRARLFRLPSGHMTAIFFVEEPIRIHGSAFSGIPSNSKHFRQAWSNTIPSILFVMEYWITT